MNGEHLGEALILLGSAALLVLLCLFFILIYP